MPEKFGLTDVFGKQLDAGFHADFRRSFLLLGHVGDRGGIVADTNESHVGNNGGEFSDPLFDFGEHLLGDGVTVDEAHGDYVGQGREGGREKSSLEA